MTVPTDPLAGGSTAVRRDDVLFVAPHAYAPLEDALPFVHDAKEIVDAFAERIADWHDLGTLEALDAATAVTGGPGLRPNLPRGLVDLNRGWRGRQEAQETLFGKGAVDAWTQKNLRDGASEALAGYHRAALDGIRRAGARARVFVELHSYGDLGSTYDRNAGGRPMLRPMTAVVHSVPWATAFPVGLARLVPANLRGTPWRVEARVGSALADHGLHAGPSPYPAQAPWTVSARWLAERWFRWLARTGRLPEETAEALCDLVWTDEQAEVADTLPGASALHAALSDWSHAGAALADVFRDEDDAITLGVELRIDLRDRARDFGEAVAEAAVDQRPSSTTA